MLVAVRSPLTNQRGPLYMDQAIAAIHQGNPRRLTMDLEFGTHRGEVSLFCRFPPELRATVEGQLLAQYPDCKLDRLREEDLHPAADETVWTAELRLRPHIFPIKRYAQFEDQLNRVAADPITAILTAIGTDKARRLRSRVTIFIRPARRRDWVRAQRRLAKLATPFFRAHRRTAHVYLALATSRWFPVRLLGAMVGLWGRRGASHEQALTTSASRLHEREEDLQGASDKLGKLVFEARIQISVAGPREADGQAQRKVREIAGSFGQFNAPRLGSFSVSRVRRRSWGWRSRPFLLSTEEVATLWHPPTLTVRAPTLASVESREFEPPVTLPTARDHHDLAVLGITSFRSRRVPFGILPDDRRRHVAIMGKTGQGKTTLIQQMIVADINAGRGVGVIDPHGDLAESVLSLAPRQRTNDVVLFDAGDADYPLAFNVLACPTPHERPLVASGIIAAFKKAYADSWGPRLEHILRNALLALLETPGATLVSILRLLSEAKYRASVVERLSDPVVRAFWQREFASWQPRFQAEAVAPIQNKIGAAISSPILRNIFGQAHSTLDLRSVLDDGRALIANLSKGRIGEDASALLGSLLVSSLQIAAMSRADMPEAARRDFYLYVDEFQNFATDSFATILSEARKYRLNLTIANQYLAQMEEQTAEAVFGNVGTLLAFQVGARDAEIVADQLGPEVTPHDLMRLPRYQAYARLLINGMPSRPFSMRTQPPPSNHKDPDRPAIIRRYCRHRYARPAARVEAEIRQAFLCA